MLWKLLGAVVIFALCWIGIGFIPNPSPPARAFPRNFLYFLLIVVAICFAVWFFFGGGPRRW